jgi:TRAP-type C4-dicarboxylate transport system permease small subunit
VSGPARALDVVLEKLDRVSDRLSLALSRFAAFVTLPALTVFVSIDVAMRYLFDSPIRWAGDANGLLLLVTIASALPRAWDSGYHIRMEIVYGKLRGRARSLADVTAAAVGIAFFTAVGVQALAFAPYMARTGETGQDLLIPVWPFMAYLGLCALLLAARLLGNPEMRPVEKREDEAV